MKSRIKQIRKDKHLTQTEFGEKIGVKGNTITNYETGLRNPTDAVIHSICREFSVDEQWLRTGEGEMYIKTSTNFMEIATIIDAKDLKIKQFILNYWELSKNDKEAFWRIMEKFAEK